MTKLAKHIYSDYRIYNRVVRSFNMDSIPLYEPLFDTDDGFHPDFLKALETMPYNFTVEHPGIVWFTIGDYEFAATPGWDSELDHKVPVQDSTGEELSVCQNLLPAIMRNPDQSPYDIYFKAVTGVAIEHLNTAAVRERIFRDMPRSSRDMVSGYLEAALFTSTPEDDPEGVWDDITIYTLSVEDLIAVRDMIDKFYDEYLDIITSAESSYTQIGHDIWYTRNGHGVGFWDRGHTKDVEEKLTASAEALGEAHICVGDDGLLHHE